MDSQGTVDQVTCSKSKCCNLRDYFATCQWLYFLVLLIAGILLRWCMLDARPFHHDESLHGMYGKYFFDFPDHNYYKYTPMLHGPFMYTIYRMVYASLGQSDYASRIPMAFVGTLFIFLPLLFRKYLSQWSVLGLTTVIALSPTLVYWARFLREDTLIVGCMALMLYAVLLAPAPRKALWFLLAFAVQFCLKENSYVTLALLLGYLIFETLFLLAMRIQGPCMSGQLYRYIRRYAAPVVLAFILSAFLYCYFYSAGFRYSKGILDGLYRESIAYWMHHHSIERISGPFLFHLYVLSWYETLFVLAFFVHLALFYLRAGRVARLVGFVVLLCSLVFALSSANTTLGGGSEGIVATRVWSPLDINFVLWRFLKLKDGYDVFASLILLVHPVVVTCSHLLQNKKGLAFFGYLFTATLFTYSYLGEKVPWLTIYPMVTGLIYLALFFDDYFRTFPLVGWQSLSTAFLVRVIGYVLLVLGFIFTAEGGDTSDLSWMAAGALFVFASFALDRAKILTNYNAAVLLALVYCIFTLRASILTNFVYAGEAREYLSQVHTTPEFHGIANAIKSEIDTELRGYRPLVYVTGEATWPATWYFRDYPEYKFTATPAEFSKFHYLVLDWKENEVPANIPSGYRVLRVNLRGWWVPEFKQMTLKKFLAYALNHTPWNPPGYTYVNLVVNPNK